MAFRLHAAGHERMLSDIAEAFASKDSSGNWTKAD
jgi:hypothetical protein